MENIKTNEDDLANAQYYARKLLALSDKYKVMLPELLEDIGY